MFTEDPDANREMDRMNMGFRHFLRVVDSDEYDTRIGGPQWEFRGDVEHTIHAQPPRSALRDGIQLAGFISLDEQRLASSTLVGFPLNWAIHQDGQRAGSS